MHGMLCHVLRMSVCVDAWGALQSRVTNESVDAWNALSRVTNECVC